MPTQNLVIVDQLPQIGEGQALWNDGVLQLYDVQVQYIRLGGVLPLSIAAPEPVEPVFVKTAAERMEKLVIFNVARVGTMPILPDYITDDANEVLLDYQITIGNPMLHDAKGLLYKHTASGWYKYGLKTVKTKEIGFRSAYTIYYGGAHTTYQDLNFSSQVLNW